MCIDFTFQTVHKTTSERFRRLFICFLHYTLLFKRPWSIHYFLQKLLHTVCGQQMSQMRLKLPQTFVRKWVFYYFSVSFSIFMKGFSYTAQWVGSAISRDLRNFMAQGVKILAHLDQNEFSVCWLTPLIPQVIPYDNLRSARDL